MSWLGVTQYLTLPAIDATLRFVAALPQPSTIVLTFVLPVDAFSGAVREQYLDALRGFAAMGEPWVTHFWPVADHGSLPGNGWS